MNILIPRKGKVCMQLCWIPSIQTNYTALYIVMYVGFLAKNIPES